MKDSLSAKMERSNLDFDFGCAFSSCLFASVQKVYFNLMFNREQPKTESFPLKVLKIHLKTIRDA